MLDVKSNDNKIKIIKTILFLSQPHKKAPDYHCPTNAVHRQDCNHHLPTSATFSNIIDLGFFFILASRKRTYSKLFLDFLFFFFLLHHVLTDPDLKSSKRLRFFNLNIQNQSPLPFKPDLQAHLTLICRLLKENHKICLGWQKFQVRIFCYSYS